MTTNSPRGNHRTYGPQVYWRRRVFALAGGLGLLGVLAWACSGAVDRTAGRAVSGTAGGGAAAAATASPARAQQPADTAQPTPDPPPATPATPSAPAAARTARQGNQAGPGAPRRGSPQARPSRPGGACAPGDLVLSLFGSGTSVGPGHRPRFQVYVVNVGGGGCTFDAGARSLNVVIVSGPDRIWSSADCSGGRPSMSLRLQRGVPYAVSFAWNRRRSAPGCRAARTAALPGTYTATAYAGRVPSPTAVFTLR